MSKAVVETSRLPLVAVAGVFALPLLGCSTDSAADQGPDAGSGEDAAQADMERPLGWTENTHGPDAMPDYDVVFDQHQVRRIDIDIAPNDWQAMLDDMTALFGDFGGGGGVAGLGPGGMPAELPAGAGQIPDEAFDACADRSDQDRCIVALGEQIQMPGTCGFVPIATDLVCVPDDMDIPMPDADAIARGDTKTERNPIWVPCTIGFEDKTWQHVGIRFKGESTLDTTWGAGVYKLPIKLDFDEFEEEQPETMDQRFYGFKRLSFASNAMDESYLRDRVAGDLFRESGVPAPRRAFYRVFVDNGDGPQYFGLYTVAEVPARPMFLTQFGGTGGNLYKPQLGKATWEADKVIDDGSFAKQTNEEDADWSDVQAAVDALHAPRDDAAAWRARLEETFDARGFMRWLAINTVIQDWDSYGNMSQNVYLYGDPAHGGRLSWIPWDHNLSLRNTVCLKPCLPLDMSTVDEQWPLIRFLFDDPVYNAAYWSYVEEFTEGIFAIDAVTERFQREHDRIAEYVIGPDGEQPDFTVLPSQEAFENSVQVLTAHVEQRHQDVQAALSARE